MGDLVINGNKKRILDPCCGSRMFWFDKHNKVIIDIPKLTEMLINAVQI